MKFSIKQKLSFLKDFNITMEEFVEDNIDEFLYDLYENKKSMVINNIEKYYK